MSMVDSLEKIPVSIFPSLKEGSAFIAAEIAALIKASGVDVAFIALHGRLVEDGVIQKGGDPITSIKDLGLYSPQEGYWIRLVSNKAPISFFTDGGIGTKAELSIQPGAVNVNSSLNFGKTTRQMVNLWGTEYGIGVQGSTQYFRTSSYFAWYNGGSHTDGAMDPGGGTIAMTLQNSNLYVTGSLSVGSALTVNGAMTVSGEARVGGSRLRNASGYGMLEANATDWLRVNPDGSYSCTAIYKPVAIGTGGLAIGSWEQLPQGELKITGSLTIGGWKLSDQGGTLVFRYNGNYVAHFSVGRDHFLVRANSTAPEGDYSAGYFYYNNEGKHN